MCASNFQLNSLITVPFTNVNNLHMSRNYDRNGCIDCTSAHTIERVLSRLHASCVMLSLMKLHVHVEHKNMMCACQYVDMYVYNVHMYNVHDVHVYQILVHRYTVLLHVHVHVYTQRACSCTHFTT